MFYCLSHTGSNRYKYIFSTSEYYVFEDRICEKCGRNVRIPRIINFPVQFYAEGGKRYPDYFHITTPIERHCGMIVSEKALQAFTENEISGFESMPIEILESCGKNLIKPTDIPQYYYITVQGTVSLDYQAMHYRKKNICDTCGGFSWSREKIGESFLDAATWSGHDLCKLTDYPNVFICTQKVIEVIKKNGLKCFAQRSEHDIFRGLRAEKIC